jgi:DNA topoisomerase IB
MPRLRRSDLSGHCIHRRRRGKGFSYRWDGGEPIDDSTKGRIKSLAIPPAWEEVWICPWPNGHIQAMGTDARGRRQYLYHDAWRVHRDREKFERVLSFASSLATLRRRVNRDIAIDELSKVRVLACAVRLLDEGCFRIGGEQYADENETFGLATLRKEHVRVVGNTLSFTYPAKGSIERSMELRDPKAASIVNTLQHRRSRDGHLFAYKQGGRWVDVTSSDINAYIKEMVGTEFSAKDFRTWSGTMLAAVVLARAAPTKHIGKTARNRIISLAVKEVAEYLGNTPIVCRKSYIDPKVIDRFTSGETVVGTIEALGHITPPFPRSARTRIETAVIALLQEDEGQGTLGVAA